jgi:hypothetical protein
MIGGVCHADQCAELKAFGVGFDVPERGALKSVDIDHHLGPHDVELHQVDERRAPGQEIGPPRPLALARRPRELLPLVIRLGGTQKAAFQTPCMERLA